MDKGIIKEYGDPHVLTWKQLNPIEPHWTPLNPIEPNWARLSLIEPIWMHYIDPM